MMTKQLRESLEAEYEGLENVVRHWRDQRGKLYGVGPDALRRMQAIKTLVEAFGYRPVLNHDVVVFEFDPAQAEKLGIPRACWPESAINQALGFGEDSTEVL